MGFGSVIATALAIIILIAAGYMLIDGITSSADATVASMKAAGDLKDQQLKTVLTLDSFDGSRDNGTLGFAVHNVGDVKITNISQLDIIVKFVDSGYSNQAAGWVPYSPGGTGAIGWTSGGIISIIGDSVNPGMLDPGETLLINMSESGGFPTNYGWVQVTAPNGASASGNFIIP